MKQNHFFRNYSNFFPLSVFFLFLGVFFSISTGCNGNGLKGGKVAISGSLTNCKGDSVFLFQQEGFFSKKIASAKISSEDGTFKMHCSPSEVGVFYIGINPKMKAPVVLETKGEVSFSANCSNFYRTVQTTGSPLNDNYRKLEGTLQGYTNQMNQLNSNLNLFGKANPQMVPQIEAQIKRMTELKTKYIDSVSAGTDFLAQVAKLHQFKQFGSDPGHSKYMNELQYYAHDYLKGIDYSSPTVLGIPQSMNRLTTYAQIMGQNDIPADSVMACLQPVLASLKANPNAEKTVLLALLEGFDKAKSKTYVNLGKRYLERFSDNPQIVGQISSKVDLIEKFSKGATPPEIDLPTPSGSNFKLSNLQGNVVMIDFWASWCKPCRRDNPHVVSLYKKYQSKGFEILGVSLDKTKDPWVKAIQQDRLTWNHVSDLKGWQSSAARLYGVSSIPATFLLDKQGKIIAKDLRGDKLDRKLKEIFGY